jgi:hypothetical protein
MPSCFRVAHSQNTIFHGSPGPDGEVVHKRLWAALGCAPPREVVVAPVVAADRIAILLYAQGRRGGHIEKFAASRLRHVCAALGSTLVRLAGV